MLGNTYKKILIISIILLFISSSIVPITLGFEEKKHNSSFTQTVPLITKGILYVGGSGPNNYTSIQSAINDSLEGDTIYVYDDSSPYYEHISIQKSIVLTGENKDTTIIDGNWSGCVLTITAEATAISGFTIQYGFLGINIQSNNNTITDNIIIHNHEEGI